MFVALKEIRFAKGRFALMTGVVALVTLLIVLLSSLTRGLGSQSTSAVESLPASHVLLAPSGNQTTWSDSVVTAAQARAAGPDAQPLTVARARLVVGSTTTQVTLFGTDATSRAADTLPVTPGKGQLVLPQETADALHLAAGDTVAANGTRVTVAAVEPTRWYSHSPVAWADRATVAALAHTDPSQATALLLDGTDAQASDAAQRSGLVALSGGTVVNALPGYSSEHGSLLMIQAFLYGICALVVLAFLSVWTIQRTRDIAVLRALGGSRRYVLGDSLGQAAILLAIGATLGAALGTVVALVAQRAVPVLVLPSTTLVPAVGVALVGLVGSVVAVRRVTTVDPLPALGGN